MDSKKKVVVAIVSLTIVIFAAIIGVVAVLAAREVTVKSNVNIQYEANANIYGSITGSYKAGVSGSDVSLGSVSFDEFTLDGYEGSLSGISNLKLDKGDDNNYITFTFVFENTSTQDEYVAKLAFKDDDPADGVDPIKNMTLTATVDGTTQTVGANLDSLVEFTVNTSSTVTFTLKVKVDNVNLAAHFVGTILWSLEIPT